MYSKNRIGNINCYAKLPIIVFHINLISLIESEEFREPRMRPHSKILGEDKQKHLWFG